MKPLTVIGFLGSTLDASKYGPTRWNKWRPSVGIHMHEDLRVDNFVMLHGDRHGRLAQFIADDIESVSPETSVQRHLVDFDDPWDFEEVYGKLLDFTRGFDFDPEANDYLIHITTGTHVAQICLFLLTEARYLPGKLLQTQPERGGAPRAAGSWTTIDLDLSRYDSIASRFAGEVEESTSFLKSGIDTQNTAFNRMIDEIEQVAIRSTAPILLMGPTGAGKSQLARRIYELKRLKHQIAGPFVEVNCATLKGDSAMSALFGHRKGAFTGAIEGRAGLLKSADTGMLFLDEIGELGLDEQAIILRAVEEKRFLPVGADAESASDFQLIAGTNSNLADAVVGGSFREDLLARLNLWTFSLPGLAERREDIEPNLDYELDRFAEREGSRVQFNMEARNRYLDFATSPAAIWSGNFRDLASSVTRMATLSSTGRIGKSMVTAEINRLENLWGVDRSASTDMLDAYLDQGAIDQIDPFDRVQLVEAIRTCQASRTLSEAGRKLFAASRLRRKSANDADRLRKYLARFDLDWKIITDG
ncbi:sigma 54-interacting transcriptional regulator [Parasphingopyxis sp. CP4]|uniref:RNA repair transcriptional activator RtcR n=1 Tax=Parasphingopyxis sp. CP4 TaxID=2724527 RepID=UPI0015A46D03|nr:RNA repair transcriptional activator RtcR [Parasphingopyxis sp. CP4]QLC20773.1 sigma 54-interacting transcriptional regulator [Parasphingopyxis sp. CP4]